MAHAHHKTDSHTVDFQVDPVVLELGQRFVDAGHELSLVGGPVRDLFLGRTSPDLDFTTDATPDQTVALIKKWADNFWEIGRAFGTIGMRKAGFQIEITTYRAEAYDPESRKPVVAFGTSLTDDLLRRDFTINAMALRLPRWNSLTRLAAYGTCMPPCWPRPAPPRLPSPTIRCG